MSEFSIGDRVRIARGELRGPEGKSFGFVGGEVGVIRCFLPGDYPEGPPLAGLDLDEGKYIIVSSDRLKRP